MRGPHQRAAERGRAGLALGCLDGFARMDLLAAGGAGGSRAADAGVQGEQEGAVPGRAESGPEEQR